MAEPSLNWTVPAAANGETVAVNVTAVPPTTDVADAVSVVVVAVALPTGARTAYVVGLLKLIRPTYSPNCCVPKLFWHHIVSV